MTSDYADGERTFYGVVPLTSAQRFDPAENDTNCAGRVVAVQGPRPYFVDPSI